MTFRWTATVWRDGTGQAGRGRTVERETHDLGHSFWAMCFLRAPGSNRIIG